MSELPLIEPDDDLLPVLRQASNQMLQPLVDYITDQGAGRWTSRLDRLEVYKANMNHPKAFADELASEIQTFGANSIATAFRSGKGVAYAEVVRDVARKLKVHAGRHPDVAALEQQVLLKVLDQAWERMTDADRRELLDTLGIDYRGRVPAALPAMAVQAVIGVGGSLARRVAILVANAIARALLGHGLSVGASAALTRAMGLLAGPIGWTVTGLWAAFDVASPAYRVTVPCVVQVAAIRQEQLHWASIRLCSHGHENAKTAAFCSTCGERLA